MTISRLAIEGASEEIILSRRAYVKPKSARLAWQVRLFLTSLLVPWIIPIGSMTLLTQRIVLLVLVVPCMIRWVRGNAGGIRAADLMLLLFSAWAALSLFRAHGPAAALQPAGVLFIETMGAYLLARCFIRDAETFRSMVAFMAKLVVLLLPFALYEWITGSKPLLTAFSAVFPTLEITMMTPRMGFWRVQGPFDHSIVFGTFCGSLFALTSLVVGHGMPSFARVVLAAVIGFTAALSMSSAPMAGVILQAALITWNGALIRIHSRWKILWGLVLVAYLVVEFGSNQTPVQFYISRFTFDQQTGWYRIWIWEYGSTSVLNHPWFGIGLHDWERPRWMPASSVDNFWLLTAMRHGLPAVALLMSAFLLSVLSTTHRTAPDPRLDAYRTGYLVCMATFAFVGSTVHFSGAAYAWFMFVFGSGAWMADHITHTRSACQKDQRTRSFPCLHQRSLGAGTW